MEVKERQEQFSLAYVKAIAAKLGIDHSEKKVDDDSVDIFFHGKRYPGATYEDPQLSIQMKCCMRNILKGTNLHYQIKQKNYNDLCRPNLLVPRYLVLLIVPGNITQWTTDMPNELILRNKAYWFSFHNLSPLPLSRKSIYIDIPTQQIFDEVGFENLMTLASQGIRL